jgi:hypothetical protein
LESRALDRKVIGPYLEDVVDVLQETERPRKLALLDRVQLQARAAPRLEDRVHLMCDIAERWSELGERTKAKSLLTACHTLGDQTVKCRSRTNH